MSMRESMTLVKRLPGFRSSLVIGAGSGVIASLFVIAQAPLLAVIINGAFLQHEGLRQLQMDLYLWFGLLIARMCFAWISGRTLSDAAVHTKAELRHQLIEKIILLGPSVTWFKDIGGIVNVVGQGVDGVEGFLTKYLPQIVYVSVLPIAVLLVVYRVDVISGIIFTITAPIIVIFMIIIGKSTQETSERRWQAQSILSGHFLDTLRGLLTLKIFNHSLRQVEIVRRLSEQYREETMKTLRVAFMSSFVLELFATLGTAMAAVGIGLRLISGHLSFTAGLTVLVLAGEFFLPLRNMGSEFHSAMNGISGLTRVFEILDQPLPVRVLKPVVNKQENTSCSPKITLSQVTFQYPDVSYAALKNVSLTLSPRTMTAVVGPSGAGKSTLLRLLMGFNQADQGQILINGLALDATWIKEWRKRIMYIPQNPYLFQGTVKDNLLFAKPSAPPEELLEAARKSGVDEMVKVLPNGYETRVGAEGYGLSGGQAQRIAIARAFLHGGDVLIMDEPSAHLDLQSEQWLRSALHEFQTERTAFVVAHRLSTISKADQIIVLNEGQIVQSGTPHELMQQKGLYQSFWLDKGGVS